MLEATVVCLVYLRRLAEEREVVALKRISDGLSLLGQPFFKMSG